MSPSAIERALGLRFKDRNLLDMALVHPSYLNEARPDAQSAGSYQRLEFLGDAVLGLAVTQELFARCPDLSEGQLTKLRSSLVKGDALADIARHLELGQHLRMGRGEDSTGGRDRDSNLAATFEALIGALFLDRGYDTAREFVIRKMGAKLEEVLTRGAPEDPKSRLQELVQGMGEESPRYLLIDEEGPDHHKSFDVEVVVDGRVMGRGRGRRKLDAERQAANAALARLQTAEGTQG